MRVRVPLRAQNGFVFIFFLAIRILEGLSIYKNINKRKTPVDVWRRRSSAQAFSATPSDVFLYTKITLNSWRYSAFFFFFD